jgi:hypothetical protein
MEISGQFHAAATCYQTESPRYPLYRRLEAPQSRSGRSGGGKAVPASASNRTLAVQTVFSYFTDSATPASPSLQTRGGEVRV